MAQIWLLISVLTFTILQLFISGVLLTRFTFVNKCDCIVWPGIQSNAGIAPLSLTGFCLQTGESKIINPPSSWGGRLWGRTLCTEDSTGKFTCVTGDCGSGELECAGGNASPPATLAEFTLDGSGGLDFYGVSLVSGYNLPMLVVPQGGTGVNCTSTGCVVDLNGACSSELKVTSSDGECVACKPSSYSERFKSGCSSYDDETNKFTCVGADYLISFCPSPDTREREAERAGGRGDRGGGRRRRSARRQRKAVEEPRCEIGGGGAALWEERHCEIGGGGVLCCEIGAMRARSALLSLSLSLSLSLLIFLTLNEAPCV